MSQNLLPPVAESLRQDYNCLITDVDRLAALLNVRLQRYLRCAPGCCSCCKSFSVSALEAALIADTGVRAIQREDDEDRCALLVAERCSIYPQRPLICRTQGLPIGYIDEINEQIEVSACPLNFTGEHPFEHDDLFLIDPFNSRLAALNTMYCRDVGLQSDLRLPFC